MGMGDPDIVTSEPTYHTAEMVRALNAAEPLAWPRYECVYGELIVSPSPGNWHQWIAQQLFLRLHAYVEASRLAATPYMAPADISWGRSDVTVQPDVFVTPREMSRAAFRADAWTPIRHLLLVAEVVSPSSGWADRFRKRRLYQERGVPLYWIIVPETRTAEIWTPDAEFPLIERERLVWHPEGADEPLEIRLEPLFAEP